MCLEILSGPESITLESLRLGIRSSRKPRHGGDSSTHGSTHTAATSILSATRRHNPTIEMFSGGEAVLRWPFSAHCRREERKNSLTGDGWTSFGVGPGQVMRASPCRFEA